MDFHACQPQKNRVLCHLGSTQLLNLWIFQMLHLSSQPNPVLPQNKPDSADHILEDHWTECRLYGCHTELARFNLLIFTRGGDCLTSGQSYKSLMRFIDPNWNTNIVHKSPMRVNDIHSPVLFRFESTTGLGHTYEYSTPLPIPLNPKSSGQCFNRRPLMRFMRVNIP